MFSTNYDEYNNIDYENFCVIENFDRGDLIEFIPGPEKKRVIMITSPYSDFEETINYFIYRISLHEEAEVDKRPHAIFIAGLPLYIAGRLSVFELWYFDQSVYAVDQEEHTFVCKSC